MSALSLIAFLGLLTIWVGYPLVVFILSWLRKQQTYQARRDLKVSVVIATCEDAGSIRARVANLLASRFPSEQLEIVVALDRARSHVSADDLGGMDGHVMIVAGDAPGGKAATLNAGVCAASGDILIFTDTAQRFEPQSIAELVEAVQAPGVGAVSGMLELRQPSDDTTLADTYWRYERWLRNCEARLHSSVGVTGAIYAMRRELWEPLPAELILDDVYAPMRLALQGWRIGFTDRAVAVDERRFAPRDEYQRKVRTLTGVMQLCLWLPGVLIPGRNPVWLQFTFHKVLRLLTPYLALVAGFGLMPGVVSEVTRAIGDIPFMLSVIAVLLMFVPGLRRTLASHLSWSWALQSSIVVATVNGMRGRWDVWRP